MSKTTIEHDEIRRWVSERGGYPARVKGTDQQGGLLRIDYPGYSGEESLKPIPGPNSSRLSRRIN